MSYKSCEELVGIWKQCRPNAGRIVQRNQEKWIFAKFAVSCVQIRSRLQSNSTAKGQLISKFLFGVFISTEKTNKKFVGISAPASKGQLISKAIYGLLTYPKKRTDEFALFAFLLFTANK